MSNKDDKRKLRASIHKEYAGRIKELREENIDLKCRIAELEQQLHNAEEEMKILANRLKDTDRYTDTNTHRSLDVAANRVVSECLDLAKVFKGVL